MVKNKSKKQKNHFRLFIISIFVLLVLVMLYSVSPKQGTITGRVVECNYIGEDEYGNAEFECGTECVTGKCLKNDAAALAKEIQAVQEAQDVYLDLAMTAWANAEFNPDGSLNYNNPDSKETTLYAAASEHLQDELERLEAEKTYAEQAQASVVKTGNPDWD